MKTCPNCGLTVETGELCPSCNTPLAEQTKQPETIKSSPETEGLPSFQKKEYALYLLKTTCFSLVTLLYCLVRVIGWQDDFGIYALHVMSFAFLSLVFAVIQYRNFGKYSRYFHTSTFVKLTVVIGKYVLGVLAMAIATVTIFV